MVSVITAHFNNATRSKGLRVLRSHPPPQKRHSSFRSPLTKVFTKWLKPLRPDTFTPVWSFWVVPGEGGTKKIHTGPSRAELRTEANLLSDKSPLPIPAFQPVFFFSLCKTWRMECRSKSSGNKLSLTDAVVTVHGTSPRWTLIMVEKAEMTPGVLSKRPFSASKSGKGKVSTWNSLRTGYSRGIVFTSKANSDLWP